MLLLYWTFGLRYMWDKVDWLCLEYAYYIYNVIILYQFYKCYKNVICIYKKEKCNI